MKSGFFSLSEAERDCVWEILRGVADDPNAVEMKGFVQHGAVSTYDHCLRVAMTSFWLARRFDLRVDPVSLVRGAFLHDFYLYDWHHSKNITHWHGFKHPLIARLNADVVFRLNEKERNIIESHMWPLTVTRLPHCREAAVVCLSDKLCSTQETLWQRRADIVKRNKFIEKR